MTSEKGDIRIENIVKNGFQKASDKRAFISLVNDKANSDKKNETMVGNSEKK